MTIYSEVVTRPSVDADGSIIMSVLSGRLEGLAYLASNAFFIDPVCFIIFTFDGPAAYRWAPLQILGQ